MPKPAFSLKNPLDARLGYQLRRASVVMMADLARRLSELGLTTTEASILVLASANPTMIQTEMAQSLGIKRANMVPLIAGLIEMKAIVREPVDGRSNTMRVTPSGVQLAKAAQRHMREHEETFFGDLSESSRRQLCSRLNAIWMDYELI